uniref:Circadian transcription modulator n=1 Tax=Gryllus bimaculatus TaxID=6999 RepID=R4X1W1_GRYBI|nr:circadian transcription modulator [Gryllus bimaculatus]
MSYPYLITIIQIPVYPCRICGGQSGLPAGFLGVLPLSLSLISPLLYRRSFFFVMCVLLWPKRRITEQRNTEMFFFVCVRCAGRTTARSRSGGRDKMNTYITELSAMVPMCHAMSRKLDKLTVLRMAVQHLKTIRGAVHSYTEGHYKPAFLSDQELKTLILQAAEGFLFVVGCDRGRILYVSESVSQVLSYSQGDLLGQSWFDILHPKDVAKVKEQLSSSDLSPRERLIDAKTMLPVKTDVPQGVSRLCPGARRSFFCRMKCKLSVQVKEEADTTTGCHRRKKQQNLDRKYCVIQCTGYLKSWAPAKIGREEAEGDGDGEACNLSCLVAAGLGAGLGAGPTTIGALPPGPRRPNLRAIQFISRHAMDGKFLFVDQRATLVLGFLPQELHGTSMYEYYHHEDISLLAEAHKVALQGSERVITQVYRFRSKDGSFVRLQSEWKSFRNPWTKDVEYLVAKNSLVLTEHVAESTLLRPECTSHTSFDYFSQCELRSPAMQGRQGWLADPTVRDDMSSGSMAAVAAANGGRDIQCLIKTMLSDPGVEADDMMEMIGGSILPDSPHPSAFNDGNDEAAMAVIMSLLEADAGLGGPVDFSGLPWPLP